MVGVPLSTWIDARIFYEASFYFSALVNLVAAIGIWFILPSAQNPKDAAGGGARAVLGRAKVWLSIVATVAVFAAMFSVYSYATAYLKQKTGLDGEMVSVLLVVFGIGGVGGNLLAGRWLGQHLLATVLGYPIMRAIAYLVLVLFTSASMAEMLPVCLLWGQCTPVD